MGNCINSNGKIANQVNPTAPSDPNLTSPSLPPIPPIVFSLKQFETKDTVDANECGDKPIGLSKAVIVETNSEIMADEHH